jgi:hypothetical protein
MDQFVRGIQLDGHGVANEMDFVVESSQLLAHLGGHSPLPPVG